VDVRGRDEVARLAAAFNAMSAEFEATDQLRRELVANVSHELRTPLSALQAVLENLVDGVQDPDEATLRAMHAQVARLDRLVAQLLDLSRLEAGAVPLDVQPLAARAILGAACSEARLHAPPGLELVVDVEPADLACAADPDRVQQVLANLVENAIRVSPASGVVTLAARAAGAMVRLEVADQGPGIPAADRARVFERFHRLDAARSGGGGGAGLGLAIARWIVELHGGRIRAEAGGAVGCRMVVELPAAA
jgi:signal transduction histidine kinase